MLEMLIALLIALTSFGHGTPQEFGPNCWEDEVVVMVVYDPYETSPGVGTYGCVVATELPVTGNRP